MHNWTLAIALVVALTACTVKETHIHNYPPDHGQGDTGTQDADPDIEEAGRLPGDWGDSDDASDRDIEPPRDVDFLRDAQPDSADVQEPEDTADPADIPDPEDTRDAGDGRPPNGPLRFVEIAAPTEGQALRLGTLVDGDYLAEPDQWACGNFFGGWAFADAYRIRNTSDHDLVVRAGVSSIRDSPSLTLTEAYIVGYAPGALERNPAGCSAAGRPSNMHAGEIAEISIPAGGSYELLVTAGGPNLAGTYTVTVYYVSGGADPDPDPDPDPDVICNDSCRFARDNQCDDGGPDARWAECEYGADCSDCGPRDRDDTCRNTCHRSNDGECDDGGPGSMYNICPLNSDCNDCGRRD